MGTGKAQVHSEAKRLALVERYKLAPHHEYKNIANELGISHATAYSILTKAGVWRGEKRNRSVTSETRARLKAQVLELTGKGMTRTNIAIATGVPENTIGRWLREAGLTRTRDESASMRFTQLLAPIAYDKLSPHARELLDDPGAFRTELFGTKAQPRRTVPWMVETMWTFYQAYLSPEDEYIVFNVFPGAGKSTLLTHDFVVWLIARERALGREPTILLGHRAMQKSTWYVKRIRQTLTNNTRLIKLYGRFQPSSPLEAWSTTELEVEPLVREDRSEKEPTVAAGAYDASLLSGRFKVCIWDDLIDKSNSLTPEQREKLAEWWEVEAETRMNPGGMIVLSNARYGPEDLSHTLREQKDPETWDEELSDHRPLYKHIAYKAHYEDRCDGENHRGDYPDGCLLDEAAANWTRIRRQQVKNEGRFRVVWQQEDTDPAGFLAERAMFEGGRLSDGSQAPGCFDRERLFGQIHPAYKEQQPLVSVISIDPSQANFWALEHILCYPGGTQVLHRGGRLRLKMNELLYSDSPGSYSGILEEWWQAAVAEGVPFTYLVYEKSVERGLFTMPYFLAWGGARSISIVPHSTQQNKVDPDQGVHMLGPLYRFGRFRLPYGGYEERLFADQFRREACAYPEGSTSDLVMAHWFPNYRLNALIVAEVAQDAQGWQDAGRPAWAHRSGPTWASSGRRELVGA